MASKGFRKCKDQIEVALLNRARALSYPVWLYDTTIKNRRVVVFDWGAYDGIAPFVVYVRFKDWWYLKEAEDRLVLMVILEQLRGKHGE